MIFYLVSWLFIYLGDRLQLPGKNALQLPLFIFIFLFPTEVLGRTVKAF